MTTYFITGCNGLIGSFIARKLLAENCTVKALKRRNSDVSFIEDIANKITWIEGDILDVVSLETAIKGVDYVIHAAAVVSFLSKDYEMMRKVNIEGTANVVNICIEQNVKKLIYISSIAALGAEQGTIITEKAIWDKSNVPSVYAQTKFEAEREVWRGVAEGLVACILNPSVVIGVGDITKTSNQFFRYASSSPRFAPMGEVSLVDVRDVADIAYLLLKNDIKDERFIVTNTRISYLEFFTTIAKFLGIKAPKQEATLFMMYIALIGSNIAALFSSKITPLSKEIIKNTQRKTNYSNEKIQTLLNFQFRNIEDTISWACNYYKDIRI
jgi:nucleoside-diphosphate-sugar epimerase